MWIFTIAPDWVIHAIFTLGLIGIIAGFLLGFIPVIRTYKLPIQIISLLIFTFGVYLQGGLADNKEWEAKANELKAKLAEMETKVAKTDVEVVEKVVTQTKVVKEKGEEIIKYVDREIVKYDTKFITGGQCELPTDFYKAYNESLGINPK